MKAKDAAVNTELVPVQRSFDVFDFKIGSDIYGFRNEVTEGLSIERATKIFKDVFNTIDSKGNQLDEKNLG